MANSDLFDVMRARPEATVFGAAHRVANGTWICVLPHRIETLAAVLGLAQGGAALPLSCDATPTEVASHQTKLEARSLLLDRSRVHDFDTTLFAHVAVLEPSGEITVIKGDATATQDADRNGLILMTSGSTGAPKYVPLSPQMLLQSAQNIAGTLELTTSDTAALALPMFHIGAYVDLYLAPLMAGGDVRLTPPRDVKAMIATVLSGDVTWAQMVPTQLAAFLNSMRPDQAETINANLRLIRLVSADLPPDLQGQAERMLPDVAIVQMYGMSETAGQITSNGLTTQTRRAGSVGRPAGADVQIRSVLGQVQEADQVGAVWVRSPTQVASYIGAQMTLDSDGWFETGDMGRLDPDGFLHLVGRDRDIINRGGEKVSFQDVERAALALEHIQEAACFAIPHPSLGQDLGLAYVATDGVLPPDFVRNALSDALPTHKLPRQFHQLDALVLLRGGKVDRAGLLAAWRDAQDTQDHPPLSEQEQRLADIWEHVLGISVTSGSLDFFDAGGDSLSAEIVLSMVEEQCAVQLEPGVLYESPTLTAFSRAVTTAPKTRHVAKLPARTIRSMRAATSSWSGRRLDPLGLIMVRNETAPGTPIFWLCNADEESTGLSFAVSDQHPVYVLRTLFRFKKRLGQGREIAKLERYYADEIRKIAQDRTIMLGGFCDGAKMAVNMLPHLEASGVHTKLFLCADQEFDVALPMPAVVARSTGSLDMPQFTYQKGEEGLSVIAPQGYALQILDGDHVGVMRYPEVIPFAEAIMHADKQGVSAPTQAEPLAARRAWQSYALSVAAPRMSSPNARFEATVTLTNRSTQDWSKNDCANLQLWARFKNFDGMRRVLCAGLAEFPGPLKRGETANIALQVTYPDTSLPQLLQVGLIDAGLGWLPHPHTRIMFARRRR